MRTPPHLSDHGACLREMGNLSWWRPAIEMVLERHGLGSWPAGLETGVGGTYPTFLGESWALKFFGGWHDWRQSFAIEETVHRLIATEPRILAPGVLASGRLFEDRQAPWPYLVTERAAGRAWAQMTPAPSFEAKCALADQLGEQVRLVQRLDPAPLVALGRRSARQVGDAHDNTALPARLRDGLERFADDLPCLEPVLVHGDLMPRHVFSEDDALVAIIDWGDAMAAEPHYEIAKLHLDLFDGHKDLLRRFVRASAMSVDADFPRRCLAQAIRRQAHGRAQHFAMDVYFKLPRMIELASLSDLDSLADRLFAI